MTAILTEAGPTALQISAFDPERRSILVVLAKRTYTFVPGQPCEVAPEQLALRTQPVFDADRGNLLITDVETYPWKLLTDVVVRGHVYPEGKGYANAEVRVAPFVKTLSVHGDRCCTRAADGRVLFSEPEPFEKMPLEYDRAYGGWDKRSEARRGNRWSALAPYAQEGSDLHAYNPFVYPRNRHGRGYLVDATPEAIDELVLPNIEDPADLLRPERLASGHPHAWHTMPLPAGTTWVPPAYFSRGAFVGMFPFWKDLPDTLPEFSRAFLPVEVKKVSVFDPSTHPLVFRFTNGASPGLQVPYLRPGARVGLSQMHASAKSFEIEVPNDVPRISVDGRNGKLVPTDAVMHHVEIEPDHGRMSIVWRGAAPAMRPYMQAELDKMQLRVEWRM
jgi:hypothetical protein